jgi:MrfA Zn-binding domain
VVAHVVQLHRLREVLALVGFTRFEAITPDILGEYADEVQRADLALDPAWYPAVENRGEGLFVELRNDAVLEWLERDAVKERLDELGGGFARWANERKIERKFPGGSYVLLHTLAHLLLQSVAMSRGYPASSIRERIYADWHGKRFGLMLYTASSDAEGTLGGLVSQARHIGSHLSVALRSGGLCSNDPVCAQHSPADAMEGRWLRGAACHGCALVAETSCEMRNDLLDRALVVPTLAVPDAAFFPAPGPA